MKLRVQCWTVALAGLALLASLGVSSNASAADGKCALPAPLLIIGNTGYAQDITTVRIVAPDGAAGVRVIEKKFDGGRITKNLEGMDHDIEYRNSEAWDIEKIYARAYCGSRSFSANTVQLPVSAPAEEDEAFVRAQVAPSGLRSLLQASTDVFADTAIDCAKSEAFKRAWSELNKALGKSKNRYAVTTSIYSRWIQALDDELWQDGCERAAGIVKFYAQFANAVMRSNQPRFLIVQAAYDWKVLGYCTVNFSGAKAVYQFQDKWDREGCLAIPARILD